MGILEYIILGIVQGITEWLPVSSSGHLVILQTIFGFEQPVVYDLMLHIGSLFVVVFVFWKDIYELFIGAFKGEKEKLLLILFIIIATIPIAFIGYYFNKYVKLSFNSLLVVGIGLIFSSILLFLSRYPKKKHKKITAPNSFFVGIFQGIAILPGVSRSGSTISSAMFLGIKKEDATKFSFLLFIPTILGAIIMEFKEFGRMTDIWFMILGTIVGIITGILSLKLLLNIIKKDTFYWFSFYCLVLGLVVLLVSLI
ncbi:MAG: undecaprenyl-diphosphate phosphatase [Candidatus Woesearchaeota archaeon]